jgi:copper chaperone CopZ
MIQDQTTGRAGAIAQAGALISAVVASACCWLPLLLLALGVSGGTLAARFEASRPVLLPVTFALLGLAFYFTYRKPRGIKPASSGTGEAGCGEPATQEGKGGCCSPEGARGSATDRLNKAMLWVVTVFVLAFAFLPNYVGLFLGSGGTTQVRTDTDHVEWRMTIQGMTCSACAAHIQSELVKVPGVLAAKVDYEQGGAVITATSGVDGTALREAVEAAGYSVSAIENAGRKQAGIQ